MYRFQILPILTCLAISSALADTIINNVVSATYTDPDNVTQSELSNIVVITLQGENSFFIMPDSTSLKRGIQDQYGMEFVPNSMPSAFGRIWDDYRRISEALGTLVPLLVFGDASASSHLFVNRYEHETQK